MQAIPVLEKRRLQAQVIKPIWEELVARLGPQEARDILDPAIRKAAIEEGRMLAAAGPRASRTAATPGTSWKAITSALTSSRRIWAICWLRLARAAGVTATPVCAFFAKVLLHGSIQTGSSACETCQPRFQVAMRRGVADAGAASSAAARRARALRMGRLCKRSIMAARVRERPSPTG